MKLKATHETEVYISQSGYLAIRQCDPLGENDSIILLSPEQFRLVAKEANRLLEDESWWTAEASEN